MGRVVRILMLGVVAVGLFLALTTTASSGRTLGQATGYGDDTIPPSQLETATPANTSSTSGGGGGHATLIFGIGLVVVVLGGAGAYAYSRTRP
jgi:hypothetical protein